MINLMNQDDRVHMIQEIKRPFNIDRKAQSMYRSDIQNGKIKPYILDELRKQLFDSSVQEMPIVSTINIQKRVVSKKACVYSEGVTRTFEGVTDTQAETILKIYEDGNANTELNKCNKKLVYENQTLLGIFPRNKKIIFKKYELSQVDAFPETLDPESAKIIVISVFDKEVVTQTDASIQNTATGEVPTKDLFQGDKPGEDSEISSDETYKRSLERYIVWSKKHHFLMNGDGEVLDLLDEDEKPFVEVTEQQLLSPIREYGVIPFIDISREKDGQFWNESGSSLSDFTVQFNSMLSDLANNAKMNGYAVGVLKAPSDLQPETMVVGASMIIKLKTDNGKDQEVDFKCASPESSIEEISDSIDKLLNYFITTEDLDSSAINSKGVAKTFSSGYEKFLAMIEKREATREDYNLFKESEEGPMFNVVRAWANVLTGTETLDKKYHTGVIALEATCDVDYANANTILTDKEKIDNAKGRNDLGLESRVTMLMKLDGLTEEEAKKHIALVDATKELDIPEVPDEIVDDENKTNIEE